ncbi:N-acetyltransferase family protein [Ursidibacter arcticus]
MQLRQATVKDAAALSKLLTQVWKNTYQGIFPSSFLDNLTNTQWQQGFEYTLSLGTTPIIVAEAENDLLAMISFGQARDPKLQIANEIYALNVLPNYQRQQIGKSLLHYALKHLTPSVYLKVADKNTNARQFYERQGFYNTQIAMYRTIEDFHFQEWVYRYDKR